MDFLQGILAIILVIIILLMRESENKVIAYIGIGILLLAKILH